jgi:hypothetical protein
MDALFNHLFQAERLLFDGEQRIEIQRARVAKLAASGRADEAKCARELLAVFTETAAVMRQFIALEQRRLAALNGSRRRQPDGDATGAR